MFTKGYILLLLISLCKFHQEIFVANEQGSPVLTPGVKEQFFGDAAEKRFSEAETSVFRSDGLEEIIWVSTAWMSLTGPKTSAAVCQPQIKRASLCCNAL